MKTALALLLLPLLGASALAEEKEPTAGDPLPGVDTASISSTVTELPPEPDEALPAGEQPGGIRVGNWDVRISGSVSYEIGFGGRRD